MPVSATAEVDPQDIADMAFAIERLQKETGRSAEQSVAYASLRIAKSGKAASKQSKKNHEVLPSLEYGMRRKEAARALSKARRGKELTDEDRAKINAMHGLAPFHIVQLRQKKEPVLIPAWERKDKRREIENRGLAKKIWNIVVGKIGAMKDSEGGRFAASTSSGKQYRVSKYAEHLGQDSGSVVMRTVNRLTYLHDAYPGLLATMMNKGQKGLHGELDRRMEKEINKFAW